MPDGLFEPGRRGRAGTAESPSDPARQQPVLSETVKLLSRPVETVNADGTRDRHARLLGRAYRDLYTVKGYEALPYAAIVYSITSCMPGVDSVVFRINGKPVTIWETEAGQAGARRAACSGTTRNERDALLPERRDGRAPARRARVEGPGSEPGDGVHARPHHRAAGAGGRPGLAGYPVVGHRKRRAEREASRRPGHRRRHLAFCESLPGRCAFSWKRNPSSSIRS